MTYKRDEYLWDPKAERDDEVAARDRVSPARDHSR